MCSDPFMATPKFDASTPRTSTPTPSARHVLPNKDDPRITPMKPLFDNDYVLTAEDKEAAIFIQGTHGPVEVVQIGDIPLRAEQLKPIYDKKYICGDVSPLYSIVHQLFELLAHHYMITNLAAYYGVFSHQRS